jgi:hypothetical protein
MRMEELERKLANGNHNIGSPLNQVTDVSWHEDTRMASETQERATVDEERATDDEARTSNMGRPNSKSLENVHEMDRNTNKQGLPVLTGEDVNISGQPNMNSQNYELDQAPLAFTDKDINMSGQQMNDDNQPEQAQAPEVNMSEQAMDMRKREGIRRGKQRDEDEEDFGFDEDFDKDFGTDEEDEEGRGVDDDSIPEIVSKRHILENRVVWLTDRKG